MMSEELRSKDCQVIVVSNRLPYEIKSGSAANDDQSDEQSDEQSGKTLEKSVSGLVTTLEDSLPAQSTWFGGVIKENCEDLLGLLEDENHKTTIEPIEIPKKEQEQHKKLCDGVFWPLFHEMPENKMENPTEGDQNCWESYKKVNEKYAKAIVRYLEKRKDKAAKIWIHDYHLFLVPTLLKQMLSEKPNLRCSIGFFLHIPFPPLETLEQLPEYKEIMEGMLGSDSIGFHIHHYKSNFLKYCQKHVMGCKITDLTKRVSELHFQAGKQKGRKVHVEDIPAGIIYEKFSELSEGEFSEKFPEYPKKLVDEFTTDLNKVLFIGVDRLDYTKGLLEKVDAFQELVKNPRQIHDLLYLQIAVPCRITEEKYKKLRKVYEEKVEEAKSFLKNNKYQSKIHVIFGKVTPQDLSVLYRKAHVALVTPIIDGLNLVALEYIACQTADPGVLILSKNAGAAKYLDDALQVDPRNIEEMVETMYKAIEMEFEERQESMKKLQSQVKHRLDAERWVRSSLEPLKKRVKNMAKL